MLPYDLEEAARTPTCRDEGLGEARSEGKTYGSDSPSTCNTEDEQASDYSTVTRCEQVTQILSKIMEMKFFVHSLQRVDWE